MSRSAPRSASKYERLARRAIAYSCDRSVAVAAATQGDGEVVVHFPGGDLRVRLAGGRAWLTGPAEPVEELPDARREAGTDR